MTFVIDVMEFHYKVSLMNTGKDTEVNTVKHKVRYVRKIMPELVDELDRWLEKKQAMLVLGITEEPGTKLPKDTVMVGSSECNERVKGLRAELEKSDRARAELADELAKAGVEIAKLRNERRAEEDPSLAAVENAGLKKRIAELESKLKSQPVSADAKQMKMLTDAALKADEEIARLKAEIVRKDYWFEHTPMEEKAKKGWVMYFQLKKSMEAKGQFDQEAAS